MVLNIILGVFISSLNTRLLGKEAYGNFKYIINVFSFLLTFSTLGLFLSSKRLIALKQNFKIKSQLFGGAILLSVFMYLFYFIIVFFYSYFDDIFYKNDLGHTIRLFSPLIIIYPLNQCLQNILPGDNRIKELAFIRTFQKVIFIVLAISISYFFGFNLNFALVLTMSTTLFVLSFITYKLKPSFNKSKKILQMIWEENKRYGIHEYVGNIANIATSQLSMFSIMYFIDSANVGFYSLAITISGPLAMVANSVGTTYYKDFAQRDQLPLKATLMTIFLSLISLLIYIIIIKFLVITIYSIEFLPVVKIAYLTAIGFILRGLGDYINRFLSAHGKGKEARNVAFANGISNVIGFVVLVYFWGIIGAAITKLISDFIYLFFTYYYYRKVIRNG